MAEPTTTTAGITLTALLIAFLGPLAGPYAAIVMAALIGALWPLAVMPSMTHREGAFFLLRIVATAVVLSTMGAWVLETRYGIPAIHGMAVVSFFIGALGNGWSPVLSALRQGIAALARSAFSAGNKEQ